MQPSLSPTKLWAFRITAAGVPSLVGLALLCWWLVVREQLVFDEVMRTIKLQPAPFYLQEPGHERTGHKYLYDPVLGWRNIPNWSATTKNRQLTINSHGLRDREYEYEKPHDCQRILVLGDSYVWGYGVSDQEVFTEVLESNFQQASRKIQVINTGVSGWGTDQQLLYLVRDGLKYQPDIVLLAFFIVNDPKNNMCSVQYGINKPVFMNLNLQIRNLPVPRKPPDDLDKGIRTKANGYDLTVRIIEEIANRCGEAGAELVIMKFGRFVFPDHPDMDEHEADIVERISRLKDKALYLDLDDAFDNRSITPEQLVAGNDDGHWNAFGHRIVAAIVQEFLESESLLDR